MIGLVRQLPNAVQALKVIFATISFLLAPMAFADPLRIEGPAELEQTQALEPMDKVWSDPTGIVFAHLISGVAIITNNSLPRLKLPLQPPVTGQPNGGFVGKSSRTRVAARCNPDGSLDGAYVTPTVRDGDTDLINDIGAQPDGKVIVVCNPPAFASPFIAMNDGVFRLNADGSHDTAFKVQSTIPGTRVLVQPDLKILVLVRSMARVLRLLSDGSEDPSFHKAVVNADDMALQADGKIVLAGPFTGVDGTPRRYL